MDAVTLAAAALAIVVDESRDAALRQALLDRERAAMTAEDRGSFLAQRLYTGSTQVPSAMPPMTWRAAHGHVQNHVLEARDVMHDARRALRRGNAERAHALLNAELDSSSEEEPAEASEEEAEEEAEEQPGHRCAICGRTRRGVTLMLPTVRWANLPSEQRIVCDDCFEALQ